MSGSITLPPTPSQMQVLERGFGDAPLGRAQVQLSTNPVARLGRAIVAEVRSLATRLTEIGQPGPVRADAQFRAGVQEYSGKLGDVLGAYSRAGSGQANAAQDIARAFTALQAASTAPSLSGVSGHALLAERLAVHLGQLSDADLRGIADGIASDAGGQAFDALKADPNTHAVTMQIERATHKLLLDRATAAMPAAADAALQNLVAFLPSGATPNPQLIARDFATVQSATAAPLSATGLVAVYDDRNAAQITNTVKERVAALPLQQQGELVALLPTKDLLRLQTARAPSGDSFALDNALRHEIGDRTRRLQGTATGALDRLAARSANVATDETGMALAPKSVVADLAGLAQAVQDLRAHTQVHSQPMPTALLSRLANLRDHLEAVFDPGTLDLSQLSDTELQNLRTASQALGIAAPAAQVAATIKERTDDAASATAAALHQVGTALVNDDLGAAMTLMRGASGSIDSQAQVLRSFGSKLDDPDKQMAFRDDQFRAFLKTLSPQDLGTVAGHLASAEVSTLLNEANYVGMQVVDSYGRLGKELMNTAQGLLTLRSIVSEAQTAAGQVPTDPARPDPQLSQRAVAAVRDAFGIEIQDMNGGWRAVHGEARPAFADAMRPILETPALPAAQVTRAVIGGQTVSVDAQLPRDLNRMEVRVNGAPILDRAAYPGLDQAGKDTAMLAAVATLRGACGSDAMLLIVSQFAQQSSFAGLQAALGTNVSMVALEGGVVGIPMPVIGQERTSVEVLPGANGSVLLRASYDVQQSSQLIHADGSGMTALDPAGSHARFTYDVRVNPDGTAALASPVRFDYALKAA